MFVINMLNIYVFTELYLKVSILDSKQNDKKY